ncbi:hypothetical protein [Bradyrhizobium sp. AUGA SZCCT0042]|uniref:hypothetical protein n=1 Tax=Bradyrhizobium sp. AUGA SZCCT0042 TaxID=2807651 RepID=UPI001BAAD51C|nr:hypothetical protein [Bradyrhizobium sp. AUGA SZCCT0042]MBR1302157.1 hypothetical protein [Bradyrhizobium sp. AUGA SZCCT0042]
MENGDRYTKAVLTVIAVCLVVIALRGTVLEQAMAESGPLSVVVVGASAGVLKSAGPMHVCVIIANSRPSVEEADAR